jgi:hypothetical protein
MSAMLFRLRRPAVVLAMVAAATALGAARAPQAGNEKSVYVLVMEAQSRKPLPNLPQTAFLIREDNIDRQVVRVAQISEPMAVVLLADTTSAFAQSPRDLRDSSAAFIKRLLTDSPKSSVALWEFGGADIPVENFTSDEAKLETATTKLFPKGSMNMTDTQNYVGSNLLEAIVGASKALAKRPEARRMIVSFNADVSAEMSTMAGEQVQAEVQKANATLVAVSLQIDSNSAATSTSIGNRTTGGVGMSPGAKRDNVLDNVCPLSGGTRITIATVQALAATLENVADLLAAQYVVTYTRPSGSAKQVQIGTPQGIRALTAHWAPK